MGFEAGFVCCLNPEDDDEDIRGCDPCWYILLGSAESFPLPAPLPLLLNGVVLFAYFGVLLLALAAVEVVVKFERLTTWLFVCLSHKGTRWLSGGGGVLGERFFPALFLIEEWPLVLCCTSLIYWSVACWLILY